MELLRQAEGVGYFDLPGKLANFKTDPDLDPRRRRGEFREFLRGLLRKEKGANP
jgi:hypothetical protein